MTEEQEIDRDDSFQGEAKTSKPVWDALRKSMDAFREWQSTCETIDKIYNLDGTGYGGTRADLDSWGWQDAELDLFWSSYEVLKPAVYARAPQPVVSPLFKDNKQLHNTTAELLERSAVWVFKNTDINDVMLNLRDDLIFAGRGAPWVRYEREGGKSSVCVEHKDRLDFLHEPARKWSEVGWVAGASWLTRKEMRKRFASTSGDAYKDAKYSITRDDENRDVENRSSVRKAKVWEVWHKADNKVYWVTDGVDVLLDSDKPHLDITGFFPCPKPAYATLKRRSLIPVPDWQRYAIHFSKISELTRRIYKLLDDVRMKGLIPAGGSVGDAVEELIRSDDERLLIPVEAAALMAGGAAGFVVWLPLKELAEAIQGLIAARGELIQNFYELSGISDIMRGATDADETLGAQELKSQYGSVRVREKSTELQRVAADVVKIAAEIIAEKFPQADLLAMSQMDIPTKAQIAKRVEKIEKGAKADLKALEKEAAKAAQQPQQGEQPDPEQAKAMFDQAQQQILAKYAPLLAEAEQQIPIEAVMELLRDDRARNFVFEIESSSTILTDELQEKRSRNEFMEAFARAQQAMMGLASMGEPGAKLAGAMMKFVLAPYRAGRELDGAIDAFIDAAPEMAKLAQGQEGEGAELVEAQNKLAEAEQMKAQAAMAGVQAKAQLDQAEMQRKMAEMQQKAQEAQFKAAAEAEKLRQSLTAEQAKTAHIEAQVNKLTAETAKILASIGLDERKQELSEYQASEQSQARQVDQQMQAEGQAVDREFRERGEARSDRQQDFTERSGERAQDFTERQALNEGEG